MFNAIRTYPAPASLAYRRSYSGEDVYAELKKIFFDKCYLCESADPQDVNIEHFEAHEGDEDKKYDWDNLYFCCSRCNNLKGTAFNEIVDCCDLAHDVFRAIKLVPPLTPRGKEVLITALDSHPSSEKTVELLDRIFNSDNTVNKKMTSEYLRKKVFVQYSKLLDQMIKYFDEVSTDAEKEDALTRMKMLIRKSMPYSAFIRWCVLDDDELGPILQEFMD